MNSEEIWLAFEKKLKTFIMSRVPDEEVANDILQETFIKIHSKIHTLKDEERINGWVFQVARNLVYDYYRTHKKSAVKLTEVPDQEAEYPEESVMTEAIQDMIKTMDDLPPEYCDILCLTELEGKSLKDYAIQREISYTAAKTRLYRARILLKNALMKCCHYESDKYGTVLDITPNTCCCCSPG